MDKENFYQATEEDIKRLEDKFGLHIETLESPQIINDIEDCNIRGILTP